MAKKLKKRLILFLSLFVGGFVFPLSGQQKTLAEIYRTGKAKLIPEITVDPETLPKEALFLRLYDISSDSRGNIYVLDGKEATIIKFGPTGKFIKVMGGKGQGPGEFNRPHYLTAAGDRIVVYQMLPSRLVLLDSEGRFLKNLDLPDYSVMPKKIRGLPDGKIILETEKHDHNTLDSKPQECRISILDRDLNPEKEIYFRPVIRAVNMKIPSGQVVSMPRLFNPDVHWDVSSEGKMLIGYSEKYEVDILDGEKGKIVTLTHASKPAKVLDKDKKSIAIGFSTNGGHSQKNSDFIKNALKFPSYMPAYDGLLWDSEGNILIHPTIEGVYANIFDAFDPEGRFIARVEFEGVPKGFYERRKAVVRDGIWIIDFDSDGNYKIVKYRFSW